MSISKILEEYSEDSKAIHAFCEDTYAKYFEEHFKGVRELYERMKSYIHPITDDELEYILTMFPLELFTVAEHLNQIRLDREVVKLKNKEKIETLRKQLVEESSEFEMLTKSERQAWVTHQIVTSSTEYEVLLAAYDTIISRVENEQSFSRELIMGAKKIWDSRRSGEHANPVNSADLQPEIPEYTRQSYIK